MLISFRTCPYQSWTNLAERVMSTLNLALQHVALARKPMDPDYEDMLKGKNTLAEVCKVLQEENPGLRGVLRDSMEQPILSFKEMPVLCLKTRFLSLPVL